LEEKKERDEAFKPVESILSKGRGTTREGQRKRKKETKLLNQ